MAVFNWAERLDRAVATGKKMVTDMPTMDEYIYGERGKFESLYSFDPFKDSVVLDIETTGLKTGSPVVEVAIFDVATGEKKLWSLQSFYKGERVRKKELLEDIAEPWFKERADTSFKDHWTSPRIGPKRFIKELPETLKGKTVLIANAPFESRMLGELFNMHGKEAPRAMNALRQQMETRPATPKYKNNLFYVTGRGMQMERSFAYQTGDWMPVLEEWSKPRAAGSTAVRDIQDLARVVFSEGQRTGLLRNISSYVGSSINVLNLAYRKPPEEHRALADVADEEAIMRKLWTLSTGMHEARKGGLKGSLSFLFDNKYREGLTAIKRLDAVRTTLKTQAVERSLAEARLNIEFYKNEEYSVTDQTKKWMAPLETYEKVTVKSPIAYSTKVKPQNFDEAAKLLTTERFLGTSMTARTVDDMIVRIKTKSQAELEGLVHLTREASKDQNRKLLGMMAKAGQFNNYDALSFLIKKHPVLAAGGAGLGVTMVGGAMALLADRESEARQHKTYIDWRGLQPYGIEGIYSFSRADPGSYFNQAIDQRILNFKDEYLKDPKKRRQLKEELKRKEAEKIAQAGKFRDGDYSSVAGRAFDDVTSNKQLHSVDLSKFNISVEDADTVTLKRKGLPFSKDISIRLAGIDAPETAGHAGDPLASIRYEQDQPYGEQASQALEQLLNQQKDLSLVVDPSGQTYGRYVGVLRGDDNTNLNLELVRQGAVGALPYGSASQDIVDRESAKRAERYAQDNELGMWALSRYKAQAVANSAFRSVLTNNTLTRLDTLGNNLSLGAYASFLTDMKTSQGPLTEEQRFRAESFGSLLSASYYSSPYAGVADQKTILQKRLELYRGTRDFNTLPGMQHKGMSAHARRRQTHFGSGHTAAHVLKETNWKGLVDLLEVGVLGVRGDLARRLRQPGIIGMHEGGGLSGPMASWGNVLDRMGRVEGMQEFYEAAQLHRAAGFNRLGVVDLEGIVGFNQGQPGALLHAKRVAKHESFHTNLPDRERHFLQQVSDHFLKQGKLPADNPHWASRPKFGMEEMLAYAVDGGKHPIHHPNHGIDPKVIQMTKKLYRPMTKIVAVERDLAKANMLDLLRELGSPEAEKMRRLSTDFGSPWQGLHTFLNRVKPFASKGSLFGKKQSKLVDKYDKVQRKNLLRNFQGQRAYTSVSSSFATRGLNAIRRMLHGFGSPASPAIVKLIAKQLADLGYDSSLIKMAKTALSKGDEVDVAGTSWWNLGQLGKGQMGSTFLYANKEGQLGVWKELSEAAMSPSTLGLPGPLFREPISQLGETRAPKLRSRLLKHQESVSVAQARAVLEDESLDIPDHVRFMGERFVGGLDRLEATGLNPLEREVHSTVNSFVTGGMSPRVLATTDRGFLQSLEGRSLNDLLPNLSSSDYNEAHSQVHKYLRNRLIGGGVMNFDLHAKNITFNRVTKKVSVIDHGMSVEIPGIDFDSEDEARMATDYIQETLSKIFNSPNEPSTIREAAVKHTQMPVQKPRVKPKTSSAKAASDKIRIDSQVKNNQRAQKMAEAQNHTITLLFQSPIGHTKGGK